MTFYERLSRAFPKTFGKHDPNNVYMVNKSEAHRLRFCYVIIEKAYQSVSLNGVILDRQAIICYLMNRVSCPFFNSDQCIRYRKVGLVERKSGNFFY